jgi:glycosyltransferase involved in cell wall biosynthesis
MRRLLQITDSYEYTGGIRSHIAHSSDLLRERGWEVEIYSPPGPGGDLRSHFTRWAGWRYLAEVRLAIRRFRPDLLHAHSLSLRLSPLPLLAAREAGIPVVMTVHDFNYVCPRKWAVTADGTACTDGFSARCLVRDCPGSRRGLHWLPYNGLRWLKTALHRRMLRTWVDRFITPSDCLGRQLANSLTGIQVATVPNFVPTADGEEGARNGLLFVGRLSREKGVDVLLRAMAIVRREEPGATLTVVGDGPAGPLLRALARQLGLDRAVTFTGEVDNRLLGEHYRQAVACVLPSLWQENCPVTGLEALAHGTPLIASNLGGLPEMARDGVTGLLFPRKDPEALADQALHLLRDPELARRLGRGAREAHRADYAPDAHYRDLTAVYEALER